MTEEEMKARIAELENEKTALKTKNSELIDREKVAKTAAEQATAAAESVAEKAEREAKDVDALEKRLVAKYQKDIDVATSRAETAEATLKSARSESAIAQAISTNNVDAKHVRAATAILKQELQYGDDGNPNIEGKTVEDWAKAYFAKDGLSYVRAPNSGGGAAQGHDGTSSGRKLTARPTNTAEWATLDAMTNDERNAFCDSISAPDLKL